MHFVSKYRFQNTRSYSCKTYNQKTMENLEPLSETLYILGLIYIVLSEKVMKA